MGFKFFRRDQAPQTVERTYHRFEEQIAQQLTTDNRPAVFLRLERRRNDVSNREYEIVTMNERRKLIEHMYREGMIMHSIVSQDEDGFTIRTEINF